MAKTFHLTVARIGENVFDGEVTMLTVPGTEGMFTVLSNHEPLVSELKDGAVRFEASDGKHYHVPVQKGGIAEISQNQATILL
ncbi:MAG: hypothetical protein B7X04_01930 [Parcubacteria group bacterium 21-54-25]|nr:MAG: hypothetical protein B7X04_01930 [Parcubacteria group bacterium 21-54-25]HQU07668.1 hypothetical protein [Candidatus Paceibacterota bacterium]